MSEKRNFFRVKLLWKAALIIVVVAMSGGNKSNKQWGEEKPLMGSVGWLVHKSN